MLGATAQLVHIGASGSSHALQRHIARGPLSTIGRKLWQSDTQTVRLLSSQRHDTRPSVAPQAKADDAADAVRETLSGGWHAPFELLSQGLCSCVAVFHSTPCALQSRLMLTEFGAGISSIEGRAAQTTNIVLGGDTSLQTWRELDEKVILRRACTQASAYI